MASADAAYEADDALREALANGVTEKQFNFMLRLVRERVDAYWPTTADERVTRLRTLFVSGELRHDNVSREINYWLGRPYATVESTTTTTLEPGVYNVNGRIYVVKPNRTRDRLYAKRLVERRGVERVNEVDDTVNFDFEYAPGAISTIRPEHRMTIEEAEKLTVRYGRCVNCGRSLKRASSVRAGIGPVCAKAFAAATP